MTVLKKLFCAVSLIALCATVATAEIKYFVGDGSWHAPGNWSPFGAPEADDTAVIGANKACWIGDGDAEVQKLDLSGGLVLDSRTLRFYPLVGQASFVYGTLAAGGIATIELNGDLTIKGTGFIRSDGTSLRITQSGPGMTFTLTGVNDGPTTPTLRGGDIRLSVSRVVNNGHILAATSDALIEIGGVYYGQPTEIQGNRTDADFKVTSGTMRFLESVPQFTVPWKIEGGTLELAAQQDTTSWTNAQHAVNISGNATLDLKNSFRTSGVLTFNRGKIKVLAGKSVLFTQP